MARAFPSWLLVGLLVWGADAAADPDPGRSPGRFAVPPAGSPDAGGPARGTVGGEAPAAVAWRDPADALAEARRDKKPVLLDVEVTWSSWCTRMRRRTYDDPGVRADIARSFVPARLDAEEDRRTLVYEGRTLTHRAFADRFRVATYPTTVFLAPDGRPITRVPGFVGPRRFRMLLRFVAEGHYRTRSWDEFAGPPPDEDADGAPPEAPRGGGRGGRP